MRLLSIPALPVLGGCAAHLAHSPVILVTERRVVYARRFQKPLSLALGNLKAMQVKQSRLGRLLGYGTLILLFHPTKNLGDGAYMQYTLDKLSDAAMLGSSISAAAASLRN